MEENMNGQKYVMKSGLEVLTEVEMATCKLICLPSLIQLIIETFELDQPELSEKALYNFKARREMLYSTIYIVKDAIHEVNDDLAKITHRKPVPWDEEA